MNEIEKIEIDIQDLKNAYTNKSNTRRKEKNWKISKERRAYNI